MPVKTASRKAVCSSSMPTRRDALVLMGIASALVLRPAWAQQTIRAIATFSILADLVKNVSGSRADLTTLVQPNADAHVYSPTPEDAKLIAGAAIVFVNGLGFEGWMTRLIGASGTKAQVVVASKGVKPLNMGDDRRSGQIDPHAWQSVANAKIYVANIRDGLTTLDAANKAFYDASAHSYLAKLDALDNEVKKAINSIPPDRRRIITTHDAFGYFADAYGMEFLAPQGVSTDAEPSARDVSQIIAQIKKQKIPAVFLENINDPRLMQQIASETGAKIGGTLYSDALSDPNGPAGTYIDMIRHNVREFTQALTA
jgi:zinc/manganese transport system substrate-binding protein